MLKNLRHALVLALLLFVSSMAMARAWPNMPPTRAIISGPGLQGEIEISDPNILQALKLGSLENFSGGAISTPTVTGQPYKIIRYFENGTFRMGDLNYYPGTSGGTGVVYFQDGPEMSGDRSPYDSKWYSTVASGDEVVGKFIRSAAADSFRSAWLVRNVGVQKQTIAFDANSRKAQFILPAGLASADGSAYWAALEAGGMTVLHSFDPANGTIRATQSYEGTWTLGAVSPTGKWLALKHTPSRDQQAAWTKAGIWQTTIAVVDTESGKTTRTLALDGNFDIDALNTRGNWLYVIEHLPVIDPDHYQVRLYDLAAGNLTEGILADKRDLDEEMAGYPTEAVAARNGIWLFTLYVGMREGHAFIHALNIEEGYAWCIDLPSGDGAEDTQKQYSLALDPDGHTIYASNAALGVVAVADVYNIGEPRVTRFAALANTGSGEAPVHSSVVSPDRKSLYFSSGGTLWRQDVAAGTVQQLEQGTKAILGLAVAPDSSSLYIARADHSIDTLPAHPNSAAQASMTVNGNKQGHCAVTPAPARAVAPAPGYLPQPYAGTFWYGTNKLWTALDSSGTWKGLPLNGSGYTQKHVWWREGYVGSIEEQPALKVSGKRLDGEGSFAAENATNAKSPDFGGNGWAMMTGFEIPSYGCWEITGEYRGEKLSYVVQIIP